MIIDTLSPNGEVTTCVVADRRTELPGKRATRKPMARIESKNERDIMFAVGMACMSANSEPGECHTYDEISDFTGLTRQRVIQIAEKGLRKIRAVLYRDKKLAKELELFLKK